MQKLFNAIVNFFSLIKQYDPEFWEAKHLNNTER